MNQITMIEALSLSVVAITVVMVVLVGLMFIIEGFRFIGDSPEPVLETPNAQAGALSAASLVVNEELKLVAALTALAMASGDQQDKKYHITSIRRIK